MPRDPARIARILARLARHWHAHPDLRLGQIVVNATKAAIAGAGSFERPLTINDVFYVEDGALEAGIPVPAPVLTDEVIDELIAVMRAAKGRPT
jgi:hypothetical protein